MGLYVATEKLKKYTQTVDTVNNIIVEFPDFQPAYEMKAKVLLSLDFNDDLRLGTICRCVPPSHSQR